MGKQFKMKTAGIIGGMEFIGCYVTIKLLSETFRVKVPIPHSQERNKPLIQTGISAHKNLELCPLDLEDYSQLRNFVSKCDILIYCGKPFKLGIKNGETHLYVPVIKSSGHLFKVLEEFLSIEKVVFIVSPAFLNTETISVTKAKKNTAPANKSSTDTAPFSILEKAKFHADKVLNNKIEEFLADRIEIIVVSPVEVKKNTLSNSSESTTAGLQFIFKNRMECDPIIKKLLSRNALNTMTSVEDLPERVFMAVSSK